MILIKFYDLNNKTCQETKKLAKNYWIDMIDPNEEEIKSICDLLKLEEIDLKKVLDKSELPHIEQEQNATLYIFNIPYVITNNGKKKYRSYPFGIFYQEKGLISVSLKEHPLKEVLQKELLNENNWRNMEDFSIFFIAKTTEYFIRYLNEIQDDIIEKEKDLIKSPSNKDLERMLTLQKSLLYFTTSLQGNEMLLEKLENNNNLKASSLDNLKDAQIEIKQAIRMASIYREILENTMDTYSSIISNNLNDIMKFLTSVTLVISIPTMISSFLGMNVTIGDFASNPYSFLLIILICLLVTILIVILLKKKNLL